MNERIVCAANKNSDGDIILGVRHWDKTMRENYTRFVKWLEDRGLFYNNQTNFSEEGFLTNLGRFVDRQEAWKIAESEGQIIRRCGGDTTDGGTLFSENLY